MTDIRYSESVFIAAEPQDVFGYRIDFTNLPAYNPNVTNLRRVDDGTEPGPGAEYRFDLTLPGMVESIEAPLRVVEADPPLRFTYETGPGFMARGECTFEPRDGGTVLTLTYTLHLDDDLDGATTGMLETSGRAQSRLELDNINRVFAR